MKYIIPGPPVPLARPRFHNNHVYDCQTGEKLVAATNLRFQHEGPLFEGPLHMDINFYIKNSKKKGWHHYRPDLDNLIKFYCDVANGILYEDDAQIAKITAEKIYCKDNSRTEITITSLQEK